MQKGGEGPTPPFENLESTCFKVLAEHRHMQSEATEISTRVSRDDAQLLQV